MEDEITRELRAYAQDADFYPEAANRLLAIAGRIDRAHAEAMRTEFVSGCVQTLDAEPDDEWLAEHGLVRLPLGADGRAIRPGDVLEDVIAHGITGEVESVEIRAEPGDAWVSLKGAGMFPASHLRHHATPARRIRLVADSIGRGEEDLKCYEATLLAIADELEGSAES